MGCGGGPCRTARLRRWPLRGEPDDYLYRCAAAGGLTVAGSRPRKNCGVAGAASVGHVVASALRGRRRIWQATAVQRRPRRGDATRPPLASRTRPFLRTIGGGWSIGRGVGIFAGRPERSDCPPVGRLVLGPAARTRWRSSAGSERRIHNPQVDGSSPSATIFSGAAGRAGH